jgi:hypothetical protein
MKKPNQKTCDALLTPIVKKERPFCEACGHPTEVAHHMVEKSRSSFLRYDVDRNLIALCQSCHAKIHNRFGNSVSGCVDIVDVLRKKRGNKWYKDLQKVAHTYNKVNDEFYKINYDKLSVRLNSLSDM